MSPNLQPDVNGCQTQLVLLISTTKMQYLVILIVAWCSASAKKEDFVGLEDLMNNPDLLSELEKRLGALLNEDGPDVVSENEPEAELPCNATTGKLNSGQSDCDFHTDVERIIKTTDSLNRGAIFVGKTENIMCAKDCTAQCCNNSECDTAVYQDKDEHKCYLFKCGIPSTCVFDAHSNYRVSSVSKEVHGSHNYLPGGAPVSHENELEKLGSKGKEPEPVVTKAPTTTEEPLVTTTRKPELGELCNYYGAKCADPHAECYMRECSCRAGYHQKYGVCRKHCREEEFECDNEGYGSDARQCIHRSYRCDGNRDCEDGSDEYSCPKVDTSYKDVQNPNVYQKQLFQYPYNNMYEGLPNQQPALGPPSSANQNYMGQVPANKLQSGQYYIPGFSNQNQGLNIPQTGSQVNNWPFMDNAAVDQSAYQNNIPYQNVQQQNSMTNNQGPNVPVMQNPTNQVQQAPVQQVPMQVHQTNQRANLNSVDNQQAIVGNDNQPVLGPARVNKVTDNMNPKISDATPDKNNKADGNDINHVAAQEKGQDQRLMNHPAHQSEKQYHVVDDVNSDYFDETDDQVNQASNARVRPDSRYDFYEGQKVNKLPETSGRELSSKKASHSNTAGNDGSDYAGERYVLTEDGQRHSAEEVNDRERVRTYPPSTKSKSQIEKPTQSTVPGRKSEHGPAYTSERIEDFPIWMQYDGDSQNINAKKGKHFNADNVPKESEMKSPQNVKPKPSSSINLKPASIKVDKSTVEEERTDSDDINDNRNYKYNRYDDDDTRHYGNSKFPSNTRDRHPSYDSDSYRDRFRDRYHRPDQDSRYPYYDNTGYRGRDRYPYPVWDSLREEYYYPDSYENRKGGSSHGLDYEDYRTDNHPGHMTSNQDTDYKPKETGETLDDADQTPDVVQPPKQTQHIDNDKSASDTHMGPPHSPQSPDSDKHIPDPVPDTATTTVTATLPPSKDSQENSETGNQSSDDVPKNSNNSDSEESETENDDNDFTYFSSENSEKVESYTDSSQGPIVALALGLAITLILLIFVGCRLRNVKRRLRKGRALHSNEADYLINGMYL